MRLHASARQLCFEPCLLSPHISLRAGDRASLSDQDVMNTSCRTNTMAVVVRNGANGSTSAAFSVRAAHKSHTGLANLSSDMHHFPMKQRKVTKLETKALGWRPVWRQDMGTPTWGTSVRSSEACSQLDDKKQMFDRDSCACTFFDGFGKIVSRAGGAQLLAREE